MAERKVHPSKRKFCSSSSKPWWKSRLKEQPFIERLLYETICLTSNVQLVSFVNLIRSDSRPLSFYQDRIRNICIAPAIFFEHATTVLSACRDIDALALSPHSASTLLYPKRLSIWLYHLDIISLPGLHQLHQLTHLQISVARMTRHWHSALEFNESVVVPSQIDSSISPVSIIRFHGLFFCLALAAKSEIRGLHNPGSLPRAVLDQ
ncbi:hypothetical protein C8J56DRAFT_170737 [Mycena floridula]|nr:hypothetical protein C8J56DRAFT_170737 [Mycena floridula]